MQIAACIAVAACIAAVRGCKPLPHCGSQGIASPAAQKRISDHWTAELFTVVKSHQRVHA